MKTLLIRICIMTAFMTACQLAISQQTDPPPPGDKITEAKAKDAAAAKKAAENKKVNQKAIDEINKKIKSLDELKDADKTKALKTMKKYLEDHIEDDPASAMSEATKAAKKAVATGDKIQDVGINEYIGKQKSEITKSVVGLKVRATGTGQTTGHIADLTVTNNGKDPVTIRGQAVYIPSDGKYQSYVGRIPDGVVIQPGQTVVIPVTGYCADVHTPPVPAGGEMPPIDTWIPINFMEAPDPLNPTPTDGRPQSYDPDPLNPWPIIPTEPVDPFHPSMIPDITEAPGYTPVTESTGGITVTYPGTEIPIGGTIDPRMAPRTFAPVIVRIVEEIEDAVVVIQADPNITTPFSNNPEREREAIIQQTFWIAMGTLTGDPYEKEDFANNVYKQFSDNTGVPVSTLPKEDKEKVDTGITDFWITFTATGVEAKVLAENGASVPGTDTPSDTEPMISEPTEPPVLIGQNQCDCGDISMKAELLIAFSEGEDFSFNTRMTPDPGRGNRRSTKIILSSKEEALAGVELKIDISDIEVTCGSCQNRQCRNSSPAITVNYGEVQGNNQANRVSAATVTNNNDGTYSVRATMPDGDKDVGFFIKVSYDCSDNQCGRTPCDKTFMLKVKRRGECACNDTYLTTIVTHVPAANRRDKHEEEFTFLEDEAVWNHTVAKDDVISLEIGKPDSKLKMDNIKAVCDGCNGNCIATNFRYKVFGTNIEDLPAEADAEEEDYDPAKAEKMVTGKKITGDAGDATISIKVYHTCASDGCEPANCDKTFTIRFRRSS